MSTTTTRTKKTRILLVDEDSGLAEKINDHQVVRARDQGQAATVLRTMPVDAVISNQDGGHGVEVLKAAMGLQPRARRILFSRGAPPPPNLDQLLREKIVEQVLTRPTPQDLVDLLAGRRPTPPPPPPPLQQPSAGAPETVRRDGARYESQRTVNVRCGTWGQILQLCTQNISQGGMFIKTMAPPAVDTPLDIRIDMPRRQSLELHGRVAHVISSERAAGEQRTPGMGVQFLNLDDEQRRHVQALVEIARLNSEPGE